MLFVYYIVGIPLLDSVAVAEASGVLFANISPVSYLVAFACTGALKK
jgi:hypothetical protein